MRRKKGFGNMVLNKRTIRELNDMAVLSTDSIQEINNIIDVYPVATQEDNLELIRQYREGNQEALELLIKVNMRLIIKHAKRYLQKVSFMQLTDIVQEIVISLINAANTYNILDPEAAFSTYFLTQTKFHVNREIEETDDLVRRPAHLKQKISKYNRVTQFNEMAGIEQSDEELKADLNLTDGNLRDIRVDFRMNATSMNATVDSSDESSSESDYYTHLTLPTILRV